MSLGATAVLAGGFGAAGAVTESGGGVDPEFAQLVGAVRGERTVEDELPGAQERLEASGDAQPGETPTESRRLELPDGQAAFVWPMDDGICYASPGPSGCFPTEFLAAHGVMVGSSGSADTQATRVFAIARDGIREVEFILSDGSTVRVPVRGNVLLEDLPQPPREARWVNADGSVTTEKDVVPRFMLD